MVVVMAVMMMMITMMMLLLTLDSEDVLEQWHRHGMPTMPMKYICFVGQGSWSLGEYNNRCSW